MPNAMDSIRGVPLPCPAIEKVPFFWDTIYVSSSKKHHQQNASSETPRNNWSAIRSPMHHHDRCKTQLHESYKVPHCHFLEIKFWDHCKWRQPLSNLCVDLQSLGMYFFQLFSLCMNRKKSHSPIVLVLRLHQVWGSSNEGKHWANFVLT